jgi:formylglycine-generating enzyme
MAPMARLAANGFGACDAASNAWQGISDWFRDDYYPRLAAAGGVAHNPRGPGISSDPTGPGVLKRVRRGKGEPNCSSNHIGMRLVKEP